MAAYSLPSGFRALLTTACLIACSAQAAQLQAQEEANAELTFQVGPGSFRFEAFGLSYQLPAGWLLYEGEDARQAFSLLFGREAPDAVFAVVTDQDSENQLALYYYEIGFVKDYGWEQLNADLLLEGIVETTEALNSGLEDGVPPTNVTGWALEPTYQSSTGIAYCAWESEQAGQRFVAGVAIRFGREGFAEVRGGSVRPPDFSVSDNALLEAISSLEFDPGLRYGDYVTGDELAVDLTVAKVLADATPSQSGAAVDAIGSAQLGTSLGYRIWIVLIAAAIAFLSRGILLRRLNALMLSESKKATSDVDEGPKNESEARHPLDVIELDPQSYVPDPDTNRERLEAEARAAVNSYFVANLVIGATYALAYYLVLTDPQRIVTYIPSLSEAGKDTAVSMILQIHLYWYLIAAFVFWNVMRFLGERNRLAAYGRGSLGSIKPMLAWLLKFFNSTWCSLIGVLVMLFTLYFAYVLYLVFFMPIEGVPKWLLLAALFVHVGVWWWLKNGGPDRFDAKLLILRVFLIQKTSAFTFRRLVGSWRHFGNYFTVADPSFYKVNWKRRFNYIFPVYILVLFLLYTRVSDPNREIEGEIFGGFVFLLVVVNIVFVIANRIRMKQDFMTGAAELAARLGRLERAPTRLDRTFKEQPVMCYENTWKQAVDGLVDTADVVLMDLRGFSESNQGCAYEVNVLFDRVRADRIVFMGYAESMPLIRKVIEQQWAELSDESPNLALEQPSTTLYTVTKENTRNMEVALCLLLDATAKRAVV